jgi:predicted TIM-barrel fold metal-dependent hydrolase
MSIVTDGAVPTDARILNTGERFGFDTRAHLQKAVEQARKRNFQDILIVDADAHHVGELDSFKDMIKYLEDPVMRYNALHGEHQRLAIPMFGGPQRQSVAGRLLRYRVEHLEKPDPGEEQVPMDVTFFRREMQSIGFDYQVVFPTPMLSLGMHPDPQIEVALSWAYSRWLTEEILPHEPRLKTMIYMPFNDPEQSLRFVRYFGDKPGVVGFMVTSARYRPVHDNVYMPIYRELEERGLTLGFHAIYHQQERVFEGMNKFLSVHALGFLLYQMVHMINFVVNGIPERFPKLKILWIEQGLAMIPFLMQRLDNEYMMRTSEAPLLKKKPSEYMRESFFYTTQPMEDGNLEALALTMKMINADTQLLFSSDYPHWDFNLPSMIWDLPFLNETQKRRILGENAKALFDL